MGKTTRPCCICATAGNRRLPLGVAQLLDIMTFPEGLIHYSGWGMSWRFTWADPSEDRLATVTRGQCIVVQVVTSSEWITGMHYFLGGNSGMVTSWVHLHSCGWLRIEPFASALLPFNLVRPWLPRFPTSEWFGGLQVPVGL